MLVRYTRPVLRRVRQHRHPQLGFPLQNSQGLRPRRLRWIGSRAPSENAFRFATAGKKFVFDSLQPFELSATTCCLRSSSRMASSGADGAASATCNTVHIDKSQFHSVQRTHGIEVPDKMCNKLHKLMKPFILRQRRQRPIVVSSNKDPVTGRPLRTVIVDPEFGDTATPERTYERLPESVRAFIDQHKLAVVPHEVHETYENLNAEQVLRKLLPADVEVPVSFEAVGHVAHFNLRKEQLPYKHLIGQVHLEKSNRQITTVLNKTGIIETVFRTFPLEVIAGDPSTLVEVSEGGARFRFDFATVYWNSRLQFEHKRLVDSFSPRDVVCDMMCGIGPFAVPAAMKGCRVFANDLNPESHKYLLENIKLNKVTKRIVPSNKCARHFMKGLMEDPEFTCTRVVMNLPDTAIEFLDVFRGGWPLKSPPPTVSTYCFSKAVETPEAFASDIIGRCEAVLGLELDRDTTEVRDVRDVAPNKHMGCITFTLPRASSENETENQSAENVAADVPAQKKARRDGD
eukprot:INCI2250.1.p1 GENE.INCI2250.1~~INCI2250.1.p1  ORF type:complete len:516 (+),score=73.01 INCI2250.1:251-1798(+)